MSDKFGLVTWNEDVNTNNNFNRKDDDYMRFKSGSNRIRLLTRPFQYWVHKWKDEGMQGFGHKVFCSKFHGSCPCCATDNRPKRRWYAGIIDRDSGTYKILDMGTLIYQQIQGYSRDEDWGDPSQYDIDIVVNKNGGASGYYNVIAKPKKSLDDNEVLIKQGIDLDSLKRKCTPPTPEMVQKRMEKLRASSQTKSEEPSEILEDEEDENMDFPPADHQSV